VYDVFREENFNQYLSKSAAFQKKKSVSSLKIIRMQKQLDIKLIKVTSKP